MQPVLTVERPVRSLSNLHKVNQLDVRIVSTKTNLKEVSVETGAETGEDLAVIEDSIIETADQEKCIKQLVLIVEMNVKYHSNLHQVDRSIAVSVTRNTEGINLPQ